MSKAPVIEPLEARIAPATLTLSAPTENPKAEGNTVGVETPFNFVITLSEPLTAPMTVKVTTVEGTATAADGDYVERLGEVVEIPVNTLSFLVPVQVRGDTKWEGNETFSLVISDPSGGHTIGTATAVATIQNDDPLPTLSVGDVKVDEGNAGTKLMTFTVTLSNASSQAITFDWATALAGGVNAADAGDFVPVGTTTETIAAGALTQQFSVTILGDTVDELEEVFFVNITNAVMGGSQALTIADGQAVGRIGNDERTVSLSGGPTVVEGNSGTQNAVFTVVLDAVALDDVTVTFTVTGSGANPATVGADVQVPGSVVIPKGQLSAVVNVPVLGDTLFELTETFELALKDVVNASMGATTKATGTITDNDTAPIVSVLAPLASSANEGSNSGEQSSFVFRLLLSQAAGTPVTVLVSTVDGLATVADGDYVAQSLVPVTIPAGQMQGTFTVKVNHDSKREGNETFGVIISNPTSATLGTTTAQATILNDDPLPTVSINDVRLAEGNGGTTPYVFVVSLSNPADQDITLDWEAVAGTAGAGDFTAVPKTQITIPAGQTSVALPAVLVNGDTVAELDETFFVNLSNAKLGASVLTFTKARGVGTIANDEATVSVTGPGLLVEGNAGTTDAIFTFTRAGDTSSAVTVDFTIAGTGSHPALLGSDFTVPALSIVIPAGQTMAKVRVPVKGDTVFEPNEELTLTITNVTNAVTAGATSSVLTIQNDDALPSLSVSDAVVLEGGAGATSKLTFTVTLSNAAQEDVLVDWATIAGGTATEGEDFMAASASDLKIAAGQISAKFTVDVKGDVIFEGNETLQVQLSNARLGTTPLSITKATGIGTIQDDEAAPKLSVASAKVVEGDAGTQTLVFTVTTDVESAQDIVFDWATGLGTATAGVDYVPVVSSTGLIPAGSKTTTLSVTINGDTDNETDETLLVNLANAKSGTTALMLAVGQATGTIQNDDRTVTLMGPVAPVAEGTQDMPGQAVFTLELSSASAFPVTVTLALGQMGDTATAADYVLPTLLTRTFEPGQTLLTFPVTLVGDERHEADETFTVKIASITGAVAAGAGMANATILNDDALPTLTIEDGAVLEGDSGAQVLTFTVKLSNPADRAILFDWATALATGADAASASDFVAGGATGVAIPAGQTQVTITVNVNGDTVDELDERFLVNVTNVRFADDGLPAPVVGDAQAIGTIRNDERTVRISGGQLIEGDTGSQALNFAVSLDAPAANDVLVTLAVNEGSAKAGVDFSIPGTLTVTIPAGQTTVFFAVPVLGDLLNETSESFTVSIVSAQNAKTGTSLATGTILDNDAAPVLTVANVSQIEGNSGMTTMQFLVTLSAASGQPVSVTVTPAGGTATLGTDFSGSIETLTFTPGETQKIYTLQVFGDTVFEADETFTVNLGGAAGATIGTPSATGTILNDEAQPTLSINNLTLQEGTQAGVTSLDFTITLSSASSTPVTFVAKTEDGTAKAGSDYNSKIQTLTIPAGSTTAKFSVTVLRDGVFEMDEFFSVKLSDIQGAAAGNTIGTGTILNDEELPTLAINDVTVLEGNSGTKDIEFTVTLSGVADQAVTFDWQTGGGSALAGSDYVAVPLTNVTIAAGQTTAKLRVTINGDTTDEADENFFITLSNAKLGTLPLTITDATGEARLLNDELSLSVADVSITEGNSGVQDLVFTVKLNAAPAQEVIVHFRTEDDSATSSGAAADYIAIGDTVLTFAPGQTEQTVVVKVKGDVNFDGDDRFRLVLFNAKNAQIADAEAFGNILDDGDVRPTISIADVSRTEDADAGTTPATTRFSFVVTLSHASDESIEVSASTVDGTAKASSDYTSVSAQRVTFAPGETTRTVDVSVLNDAVFEMEENFRVVLSDPLRATLLDFDATGTIQADDDALPRLKITGQSLLEGHSGEKFATFTIERIGATEADVTFTFESIALGGDSAVAGVDFESLIRNITLTPNQSSTTVQVRIFGDTVDEADETFSGRISAITGAKLDPLGDGQAKVTILNDDLTVAFQQTNISLTEGADGQSDLVFTVALSAISTHDVTVNYTVTGLTATAGVDFIQPTLLTLTIPAGQLTGEIRVPIQGDKVAEADESLNVMLTSTTQAVLAATGITAVGTILNDDAALSISNGRVLEGNSGTRNMVFTVTLKDASVYPVTVAFATENGTALLGSDYGSSGSSTPITGILTFGTGETIKEILIPILGDVTPEGDENFKVILSDATVNGVAADALLRAEGIGTIQDDEAFLSIADVTIAEGDSGTTTALFTITLSPASAFPVSVIARTQDGTATSVGGSPDYVAKTQTITFNANETSKTFAVTINGDRTFENATEFFKVLLEDAAGAVIVDGEATGTIINSADTAPTIRIDAASALESAGNLLFTVSLSQAVDADVTFDLTTQLASALNAASAGDFNGAAQTGLIIPAGQKSITVAIPLINDAVDELDEVFEALISNASTTLPGGSPIKLALASGGKATGTILDDDLTVSFGAAASVIEGNTGNSTLFVPVTLSAIPTHDVTVTYTLAGLTATAGTDFIVPTTQTLIFKAGEQTKNIAVSVKSDTLDEDDETLELTLTGATNAQLSTTRTTTATILDDDAAPIVTITDATSNEGQPGVFTVTLSSVSSKEVRIKWVTESVVGGATPGDGGSITTTQGDFKHFSTEQTLIIPAGQKTGQILVPTVNDLLDENAETYRVRVLPSTENADVGTGLVATGTIAASDLSTLRVNDVTVIEGNSGTQTVTFTITRSGDSTLLPVTVDYITANGTALASAGDYVATSGTLSFGPGELSKTVTVTINGDTDAEIDEVFFLNLSNAVGATIADNSGTATIRNDEVTYRLVPVSGGTVEVQEDNGTMQRFIEFKVERTGALGVPGSVAFTSALNNAPGALLATEGVDFVKTAGSVSFAASTETTQVSKDTIRIPIIADTLAEGNETFVLRLSSPVNGIISTTDGEKIITILDNDAANLPLVRINDARIEEGGLGNTPELVFRVRLVGADGKTPQAAGGPITVTFSTQDGTAIGTDDYTPAVSNASILFAVGQTEREIRIAILGDNNPEPAETLTVRLDSAVFATPGSGPSIPLSFYNGENTATGTILNDDLTVSIEEVPAVPEGSGTYDKIFTVTLGQIVNFDVTVKFTTSDGTAVSTGDFKDFTAKTGTVTIPAGQLSETFTITIHGDSYAEDNESFTVTLSEPTNAQLGTAFVTVGLNNDDATPSLSIGDASLIEGDSGRAFMIFNVILAGGTRETVTVDFTTIDGTAKSSGVLVDFEAVKGSLSFPASATGGVRTILVPIFGDTWKELNETFTVQLSNPILGTSVSGITLADATATGTILDNGDATVGIFVNDTKVVEGSGGGTTTLNMTVELTAPLTSAVNFKASTRPGTAKVGDYTTLKDQPATIAAGNLTATVPVTITRDSTYEDSEYFFLDVNGLPGTVRPVTGSGGTVSGRGIILNDDIRRISANEFDYIDVDGDRVNVKLSKGSVSLPGDPLVSTADITFLARGTVGGNFLQRINLSDDGLEFNGVSITITARPQVLVTGEILGDGRANVGAIDAAVPQAGLFQFSSGITLGKVTVPGDLGRVIAGSVARPAGIVSLNVGSLGSGADIPNATVGGLNNNASLVLGPLSKMTVRGDVTGSLSVLGDGITTGGTPTAYGKIGTLTIQGALRGGAEPNSGQIAFSGGIGKATIGSIIGGTADFTGTLVPVDGRFTTSIGSLTVLGDIRGGDGQNTAFISTARIGSVTLGKLATSTAPAIEGSLIGGKGSQSGTIFSQRDIGRVLITGDIQGGAGPSSGELFAGTTLGKTIIKGDIIGGNADPANNQRTADTAGSIFTSILRSTLTVEGDIRGGTGPNSGVIVTNGLSTNTGDIPGNAPSITLGKKGIIGSGDLIGGRGEGSGRISIDGTLNRLIIYGDIQGGAANNTGGLDLGGRLTNAFIQGSLLGGSTASNGPTTLLRSGFLLADDIGNLTIRGSIRGGENLGTSLTASASIQSQGRIGSLTIGDDVKGDKTANVLLSALQGIGTVKIGGDMRFAEILAGYSNADASNPRGVLRDAGAGISSVSIAGVLSASSIVAGVDAGGDKFFGTLDDQATNGTQVPPVNLNSTSRIASIVVGSIIAEPDAPAAATYGIVAEQVTSLKIGTQRIALLTGPSNDDIPDLGGLGTQARLREI